MKMEIVVRASVCVCVGGSKLCFTALEQSGVFIYVGCLVSCLVWNRKNNSLKQPSFIAFEFQGVTAIFG